MPPHDELLTSSVSLNWADVKTLIVKNRITKGNAYFQCMPKSFTKIDYGNYEDYFFFDSFLSWSYPKSYGLSLGDKSHSKRGYNQAFELFVAVIKVYYKDNRQFSKFLNSSYMLHEIFYDCIRCSDIFDLSDDSSLYSVVRLEGIPFLWGKIETFKNCISVCKRLNEVRNYYVSKLDKVNISVESYMQCAIYNIIKSFSKISQNIEKYVPKSCLPVPTQVSQEDKLSLKNLSTFYQLDCLLPQNVVTLPSNTSFDDKNASKALSSTDRSKHSLSDEPLVTSTDLSSAINIVDDIIPLSVVSVSQVISNNGNVIDDCEYIKDFEDIDDDFEDIDDSIYFDLIKSSHSDNIVNGSYDHISETVKIDEENENDELYDFLRLSDSLSSTLPSDNLNNNLFNQSDEGLHDLISIHSKELSDISDYNYLVEDINDINSLSFEEFSDSFDDSYREIISDQSDFFQGMSDGSNVLTNLGLDKDLTLQTRSNEATHSKEDLHFITGIHFSNYVQPDFKIEIEHTPLRFCQDLQEHSNKRRISIEEDLLFKKRAFDPNKDNINLSFELFDEGNW